MNRTPGLGDLVTLVTAECRAQTAECSLLMAVSGIDGAGKDFVARQLARLLRHRGLRVAEIGVDP